MSKIYNITPAYRLVKNYVLFCFKQFYPDYIIVGQENIPSQGSIIFAPNHLNALMDALAVSSAAPNSLAVVYLARADIFNNKSIAKLLTFFKIMPAFRMRDGMENLSKNNETFDKSVEVLDNGSAFCIMPEGNQGDQRKLRPIVKGIFRIAFAAQHKHGSSSAIKIVPIGLDYTDFKNYGGHIIIQIGKPIEVAEYMKDYAENQVYTTNAIRNRLRNALSDLTIDIATDENYNCFETITEIAEKNAAKKMQLPNDTLHRFYARQTIAKQLISLEKSNYELTEKLKIKCEKYTQLKKSEKITEWQLNSEPIYPFKQVVQLLTLLFTFPIFIVGFFVNTLPFFSPVMIRKYVFKPKFEGFFSSLHFGLGILTFPIFYVIQALLFDTIFDPSIGITILFFFLQYPFGKMAELWFNTTKKSIARLRFQNKTRKPTVDFKNLSSIRQEIIQIINELN